MDLLVLLKEKAEYFLSSKEDSGVSSVISHIEIAEKHFDNSKNGEDYLLNDVIYRCNQAFEGALKESYRILTGSENLKITPNEIEKYFIRNKILKERVSTLFTNYRTEWRNKSTHDYNLFFSEQEAFLAIVNISAFINILLDQMIEKKAYDDELKLLSKKRIKRVSKKEIALVSRVLELLKLYSSTATAPTHGAVIPRMREAEVSGMLAAFLTQSDPQLKIEMEKIVGKRLRPDFLISDGKEQVILELKTASFPRQEVFEQGSHQVLSYLRMAQISKGILFVPPIDKKEEMEVKKMSLKIDDVVYEVIQVFPKRYSSRLK